MKMFGLVYQCLTGPCLPFLLCQQDPKESFILILILILNSDKIFIEIAISLIIILNY